LRKGLESDLARVYKKYAIVFFSERTGSDRGSRPLCISHTDANVISHHLSLLQIFLQMQWARIHATILRIHATALMRYARSAQTLIVAASAIIA
jgi:hypothetical protein